MHLPIDSEKGTYVLILRLEKAVPIKIGKLGRYRFKPGYYAYVGSAFGPGGLGSRIGRHQKVNKPRHWHIDYLRRRCRLSAVWYMAPHVRREHDWAGILLKTTGASVPVSGFGSSDCGCLTHLVWFKLMPCFTMFKKMINDMLPCDPAVQNVSRKKQLR